MLVEVSYQHQSHIKIVDYLEGGGLEPHQPPPSKLFVQLRRYRMKAVIIAATLVVIVGLILLNRAKKRRRVSLSMTPAVEAPVAGQVKTVPAPTASASGKAAADEAPQAPFAEAGLYQGSRNRAATAADSLLSAGSESAPDKLEAGQLTHEPAPTSVAGQDQLLTGDSLTADRAPETPASDQLKDAIAPIEEQAAGTDSGDGARGAGESQPAVTQESPPPAQSPPERDEKTPIFQRRYFIKIVAPQRAPRLYDVHPDKPIMIGSGADCDIIVADPAIGMHHARLSMQDGMFWIECIGAGRTVAVNGEPHVKAMVVFGHTTFGIGSASLICDMRLEQLL